ncbi:MAG: A/G-specific adenine glycosylase [Halobacteriota archaeon]
MVKWGAENFRDFPWRSDRSPYKVLVAEVVLRRTTATAAARVYGSIIQRYPGVGALSQAEVRDLEAILRSVGYYKQRARILRGAAASVVELYKGDVPDAQEELLRIPHVGPYTAGAILCLGFGIPSAMVDSNVQRIISRLFCNSLPDNTYSTVLGVAEALVPKSSCDKFNLAMLDLGALVCRYDRPHHDVCPLSRVCDSARLS